MRTSKKPLYSLPRFGRMTLRSEIVRGLLLYLFFVTLVALAITQYVARRFGYPESFGEPFLPYQPSWRIPALGLTAFFVVLGVVLLVAKKDRKAGLYFLCIAPVAYLFASAPLYNPFAFTGWMRGWGRLPEFAGLHSGAWLTFWVAAGVGFVAFVVWAAVQARRLREKPDILGSAGWATRKDIEKAELFGKRGIILGVWEERGHKPRYLRSEGPYHVWVMGPPRSGKGQGIVVPTLCSWRGSALIHDAKGELWHSTAGWRSSQGGLGGVCLRFDPTCADGTAARFNPLTELRPGPREVADVQNMCDLLVDPQGDGRDDHWTRSARDLLTAAVLHVLYSEVDKTLSGVTRFLSDPYRTLQQTLEAMLTTDHLPVPGDAELLEIAEEESGPSAIPYLAEGPPRPHPIVASLARSMLDKDQRELSGIQSTALALLSIYRDPVVAENIATSDFRLTELMSHERPISLYLTVPASDTKRARPLVRLLLNQVLRRLTEKLEMEGAHARPAAQHELLLMLDEFPLLGRLPFIAEALALVPGYGIRACLITQGLSQHKAIYAEGGRYESIVTTCDIRVALAANDPESAEYFSKLSGVQTVHQEKRDYRGDRFDLVLNKQYVRQHESQRPLLYPDEILRLPKDDVLIIARSTKPIRGTRVVAHQDRALSERTAISPPAGRPTHGAGLDADPSFWELLGQLTQKPPIGTVSGGPAFPRYDAPAARSDEPR